MIIMTNRMDDRLYETREVLHVATPSGEIVEINRHAKDSDIDYGLEERDDIFESFGISRKC